MMSAAGTFAAGMGFGAGLMYFLDPDRGARRRTHARNQVIHASHAIRDNARTQLQALRQASDEVDDRRSAWTWPQERGLTTRRVVSVLASAASLGLVARAVMNGRTPEFELRS